MLCTTRFSAAFSFARMHFSKNLKVKTQKKPTSAWNPYRILRETDYHHHHQQQQHQQTPKTSSILSPLTATPNLIVSCPLSASQEVSAAPPPQPFNLSSFEPINLSTYQPFNLQTHQPFNQASHKPLLDQMLPHHPPHPCSIVPIAQQVHLRKSSAASVTSMCPHRLPPIKPYRTNCLNQTLSHSMANPFS
jgi:hypothetical protein